METRKRVLGDMHPSTLTSMATLASTYSKLGRWEEAVELQERVLEIHEKTLCSDHPGPIQSMADLASMYWNQGRNSQAIALMQVCLQIRRRVLSDDHPDIVSSLRALEQWEAEEVQRPEGAEESEEAEK